VIAGDLRNEVLRSRLAALSAVPYWGDSDLVFATRSMFGGVPRAGAAAFFLDESAEAQHFRYFRNARTAKAIVDALVSDAPEGFRRIGTLSWAGQSATGSR